MTVSALDLSILRPALVAGLLVTATHVPLGTQVLARGIVFIDLAIAQIAGCGVLLADRMGFEAEGIAVQVAALAAALAGALLLTWTERRWPDVQEAVIGVVFVLAATGGILLLASNVHGSEHLRDLLVGQILWVQPRQLAWAAVVYAVLLALWFGARAATRAHGLLRALRVRSRCRCSSSASTSCSPRSSCRRSRRRNLDELGSRPRGCWASRVTPSASSSRRCSTCRADRSSSGRSLSLGFCRVCAV